MTAGYLSLHCGVDVLPAWISGTHDALPPGKALPRKAPLEIMRQVQITAGSIVVLGAILAATVNPGFIWLSAFIGAGLTCVWLEIGRPLRAINVFFHPQTSWMTREGIVAVPINPETGLRDDAGTMTEFFFSEFPPRRRDDSLVPGKAGKDIRDQLF